ncbi:dienelactone hydrolase family protein [Shumkonia mesophila]|uniref:dienelactone hydrolase family protein n=1 Tax=Shumkonia mesophila TaxID=2838854 RepID=UPI0029353052|nr:dienelactone hydrolase family protein [Shumkonia mesophila]
MNQDIIRLYDEYTHAPLPRRVFLERLSVLAGSSAAAAALLPVLENNYAHAAMVAETDPRIEVEKVSWDATGQAINGYLAKPKSGTKLGAVIVIHENRGLNPHIQDVARRMAAEGFLALAPDMLSPVGGTPADEDAARDMIGKLDREKTVAGLVAAVPYMAKRPEAAGKVGCVGFCWGGAMANMMAVRSPELAAAVAYYGSQPTAADAAKIKARVMLHYAGLDERINAGIPAYEEALKKAGVNYQVFVYDGVNHAFNNDTNTARYDAAAAKLAWERTVGFLKQSLVA